MMCEAQRYTNGDCSETPPKFRVVYRSSANKVIDEHPACFRHGLAEVERHHASAGIALCALEPA